MKRSGFQRHPLDRPREPHPLDRPRRAPLNVPDTPPPTRAVMRRDDGSARCSVLVPKVVPLHSEPYRRLVAAEPCIRCGIAGYSQAAHPNTDKAKGAKADDRTCFPLCSTRPLIDGCHVMFDQHRLFARDERRGVEQTWGAQTRGTIVAAGAWPKGLPLWSEA